MPSSAVTTGRTSCFLNPLTRPASSTGTCVRVGIASRPEVASAAPTEAARLWAMTPT
ncbi:hypothetical protein DPMN_134340 [Dreissena polymorpha]|uniref:Uncharacterized protein n=1 Tax=Dreissena polymorpha TaxID=45954 RepID=A0A9D4JBT6_DREPO|nr:hypothetical protein DPMN_134340 [Dreissena polymorpha]